MKYQRVLRILYEADVRYMHENPENWTEEEYFQAEWIDDDKVLPGMSLEDVGTMLEYLYRTGYLLEHKNGDGDKDYIWTKKAHKKFECEAALLALEYMNE